MKIMNDGKKEGRVEDEDDDEKKKMKIYNAAI